MPDHTAASVPRNGRANNRGDHQKDSSHNCTLVTRLSKHQRMHNAAIQCVVSFSHPLAKWAHNGPATRWSYPNRMNVGSWTSHEMRSEPHNSYILGAC